MTDVFTHKKPAAPECGELSSDLALADFSSLTALSSQSLDTSSFPSSSKITPRSTNGIAYKTALALAVVASTCQLVASDVNVEWDWNDSPDRKVGGKNRLYYAASEAELGGDYLDLEWNATGAHITNLRPGVTYYMNVTYISVEGEESEPSNTIHWTSSPDAASGAVAADSRYYNTPLPLLPIISPPSDDPTPPEIEHWPDDSTNTPPTNTGGVTQNPIPVVQPPIDSGSNTSTNTTGGVTLPATNPDGTTPSSPGIHPPQDTTGTTTSGSGEVTNTNPDTTTPPSESTTTPPTTVDSSNPQMTLAIEPFIEGFVMIKATGPLDQPIILESAPMGQGTNMNWEVVREGAIINGSWSAPVPTRGPARIYRVRTTF